MRIAILLVCISILFAIDALNVSSFAATFEVTSLHSSEDALVTITGDLDAGDVERFRTATFHLSKAIVAFASRGGSLIAGIEIGTQIRLKGFSTLVPDGSLCASACGIAWLGGVKRLMGPSARVGFHAAYVVKDGVETETSVGNALVGAYFNRIGLPDRAIVYLTHAAPDDIQILSFPEAASMGIDVVSFTFSSPTDADSPAVPSQLPFTQVPTLSVTATSSPVVSSRYIVNDCGSISDLKTGLDWVVGPDKNVGWGKAFTWVSLLRVCGEDWELPSASDLKDLFDATRSAGVGYLTRGKRWPAHIDPVFTAIGEGAWVWTNVERRNVGFAVNMNQDIEVRLPAQGYAGTVRAFAVNRSSNSPPLIVRRFYEALGVGDGARAAAVVVPEKRARNFSPEAMSRFYGSLVEPLRLVSISPREARVFVAKYEYRTSSRVCDGEAEVTVEDRSDRWYISGIKSKSGC